jgi:biopolymer transport protein ExbD
MQLPVETARRPMLEPMLPLINVVFLLLVFFMVAGTLGSTPPVDLDTPQSTSERSRLQDMPRLSLDQQGKLYLDAEPIPLEEVRGRASVLLSQDEPKLHAAAGVSMSNLRPVLEALRDAGFDTVRLVTEKAGRG